MKSVHFDPDAWEDFQFRLSADRKVAVRIVRLINEIQRDPFTGSNWSAGLARVVI